MTHVPLTYLYTLGGSRGLYRTAVAPPPSDPAQTSGGADLGTRARAFKAARARGYAIEDAGVRAGEIVGYRAWSLTRGGRLASIYVTDYEWTPGGVEHADVESYGIHAFKTLETAREEYECASVDSPVVFGSVDLWGSVIEHETGYRSEYAAVSSLVAIHSRFSPWRPHRRRWWKPWGRDTLGELRARYGVPFPV